MKLQTIVITTVAAVVGIVAVQAQTPATWKRMRNAIPGSDNLWRRYTALAGDAHSLVALSRVDDGDADTAAVVMERSIDNGNQWTSITPPGMPRATHAFVQFPTLNAIAHPSENFIVAVGDSGVVTRSTDGGQSWTLRSFDLRMPSSNQGVPRPFVDVHFPDERHGAIIAGTHYVLRTDDGGDSWKVDTLWGSGGRTVALAGVFRAEDGSTIVADQANTIWRLPENGPAKMDTPFVRDADQWDGTVRFSAAGHRIWCTTFRIPPHGQNDWANTALTVSNDNGRNWNTMAYEIFPSMRFGARFVSFADPNNGMMIGLYGTQTDSTRHTSDGGMTWTPRPFPTNQFGLFSPAGLVMLSPTKAVAVSVAGDMVRWDPEPNALGTAPQEARVQRLSVVQSHGGTVVRVGRNDACRATNSHLRLFDLCGKLVGDFSETLDHSNGSGNVTSFELPPLQSGAYVLQFDACGEIETRTFVATK